MSLLRFKITCRSIICSSSSVLQPQRLPQSAMLHARATRPSTRSTVCCIANKTTRRKVETGRDGGRHPGTVGWTRLLQESTANNQTTKEPSRRQCETSLSANFSKKGERLTLFVGSFWSPVDVSYCRILGRCLGPSRRLIIISWYSSLAPISVFEHLPTFPNRAAIWPQHSHSPARSDEEKEGAGSAAATALELM